MFVSITDTRLGRGGS